MVEVITAVQYDMPVKFIVLDNEFLGMVRQWQEMFYEERYSEVYLSPDMPDYVQWAEAMGKNEFLMQSWEAVPQISKVHAEEHASVLAGQKAESLPEWWVEMFSNHAGEHMQALQPPPEPGQEGEAPPPQA